MELKLRKKQTQRDSFLLLIVPYGIETDELEQKTGIVLTFNRTLWN